MTKFSLQGGLSFYQVFFRESVFWTNTCFKICMHFSFCSLHAVMILKCQQNVQTRKNTYLCWAEDCILRSRLYRFQDVISWNPAYSLGKTKAPSHRITYWVTPRKFQINVAKIFYRSLAITSSNLCLIRPPCCFCFSAKASVAGNPLNKTDDGTNFLFMRQKQREVMNSWL